MQRWPRRGEIWKGLIAGQPYDPHQPRPLLVISEDIRNEITDDVIVVPIFSSGGIGWMEDPTRVPIRGGMGGLEHDSVIFCEEVFTIIHEDLANAPLGGLVASEILDEVVRGILRAITPLD